MCMRIYRNLKQREKNNTILRQIMCLEQKSIFLFLNSNKLQRIMKKK